MKQSVKYEIDRSGAGDNLILKDLASKMSSYLVQSRSDNTVTSYFGGFKMWKSFIRNLGFDPLPAQPIHVALYITNLLDTGSSSHVINHAIYSIKWVHDLNNLSDPTDNAYVKSLQETYKAYRYSEGSKEGPSYKRHVD